MRLPKLCLVWLDKLLAFSRRDVATAKPAFLVLAADVPRRRAEAAAVDADAQPILDGAADSAPVDYGEMAGVGWHAMRESPTTKKFAAYSRSKRLGPVPGRK